MPSHKNRTVRCAQDEGKIAPSNPIRFSFAAFLFFSLCVPSHVVFRSRHCSSNTSCTRVSICICIPYVPRRCKDGDTGERKGNVSDKQAIHRGGFADSQPAKRGDEAGPCFEGADHVMAVMHLWNSSCNGFFESREDLAVLEEWHCSCLDHLGQVSPGRIVRTSIGSRFVMQSDFLSRKDRSSSRTADEFSIISCPRLQCRERVDGRQVGLELFPR